LYKVDITTASGCLTTDTQFVKIVSHVEIYVPNAFTPNGDGQNNVLRPLLRGVKQFHYFKVFNRFGQKVFSSQGDGPGWDGNLNGKPQPVGTYVWLIKGRDYLGNIHSEKGTVVLIR